jgi:hypothetical protein
MAALSHRERACTATFRDSNKETPCIIRILKSRSNTIHTSWKVATVKNEEEIEDNIKMYIRKMAVRMEGVKIWIGNMSSGGFCH